MRNAAVATLALGLTMSAACGENDNSTSDAGASAQDGATSPDAATPDAGDPFAARPLGQCTVDSDCPQGPMGPGSCSRTAPGGICLGCGTGEHCPADTSCSQYGSCNHECSDDEGCPPGMACGATGLCRAADCVGGVCPVAMFGCDSSDRCARVACGASCPEDTSCVEGLCVEDRQL